jgi:multiple sugar transport system permease protein
MVGSHNNKEAIIFLFPLAIIFTCFLILPIFIVIGISFTEYDILLKPVFVGFTNYLQAIQSKRVLGIFLTTFKISLLLVLLHGTIGLFLAMLVHSNSESMQGFFRFILYAPVAITTASMAIAWSYMYSRDFGVINWLLSLVNVDKIAWLTSTKYVMQSIAIFSVWKFVGTSFLYYYIGLCGIPTQIYEASYIDGANPIQRFFKITLPLLSPTIFFVTTILFINTLQIFDEPFFLTGGGPGDASRTVNLFIYEKAFGQFDMGFSSALSVLLFVIILCITIFQNKFSSKWVNYDR